MAREALRFVRGTNGQVAAYTGPTGEPVFNTDTKRVHAQDGATPGGVPQARLDDIPTGALASKSSVGAADIDDNSVGNAEIRDSAALSVIGRAINTTGDPADIAAATDGHVLRRSGTALGFGTVATAGIADNAVTNVKLADMATATIKGRVTAGTGDPEDLTVAQAQKLLLSWVPIARIKPASPQAFATVSGLSLYSAIRITGTALQSSLATMESLLAYLSNDSGATFKAASGDYAHGYVFPGATNNTVVSTQGVATTAISLATSDNSGHAPVNMQISGLRSTSGAKFSGIIYGRNSGSGVLNLGLQGGNSTFGNITDIKIQYTNSLSLAVGTDIVIEGLLA